MKTEEITLYFQQGTHDKIYQASLTSQTEGYSVNFAYGRRGTTLKTGTKTQIPIPYEKAKKVYDKLIQSKMTKGYIPNEDTTAYVYPNDQVHTGIHCQLLNPIEKEELKNFIEDDIWWAQEKKDGKRMLLKKEKDEVIAINRKGLVIGAPEPIILAAKTIEHSFIIDGEAVGNTLFVFDLLAIDGNSIVDMPYENRLQQLETISFPRAIQVVTTAKTKDEKEILYDALQKMTAEGIVFKNCTAPYTSGRPNSGGAQRKFKFYDTASVIVTKINDKRSVGISILDGDQQVAIGNVTIAVNKDIPVVDDIIEVRYLYAYKGGSLYQPTFLNVRTDMLKEECVITQLKYKQET